MNDIDPNTSQAKINQNVSAGSDKNEYEAIVQRLAFAAINEQRRSRRWRIFFIVLTFIYLTPVLMIAIDLMILTLP